MPSRADEESFSTRVQLQVHLSAKKSTRAPAAWTAFLLSVRFTQLDFVPIFTTPHSVVTH